MTAIPLTTTVTGSGPGIVLAHGASGSIESNFGGIVAALAAKHTVVASDYPGDDTCLDVDGLADTLVAAAVEAGVETFTIIGYSLGTTVAVRAAVRHPDRIRGLVLAAGFSRADNRARIVAQAWQDLLDLGDTETFARLSALVGFSADHLESLSAAASDALVRQMAGSVPGGTRQQAVLVENVDTTDDLAHVAVPTLVVNATADLLIHPANSRALAAAIPGAEYTEIHAGHVLMIERPEEWWKTIDEFLCRHGL